MCGIAGVVARAVLPSQEALLGMVRAIEHRGPDSNGLWRDDAGGVALGSTRLAVRDLSPAGAQPMVSASGRYVIVFNGELYNNSNLRQALSAGGAAKARPICWRGESDTETLLAAIDHRGVEMALPDITGMYACAVWDRHERALTLVRDRFGEKPLYYGYAGPDFVFGSELKVLRCLPNFSCEIDRNALALLLRHNCIPAPKSIYAGILKLPAAHVLKITRDDVESRRLPAARAYWSAIAVAEQGCRSRLRFDSDTDAIDAVERRLRTVIRNQMVADVPLGAFLSGGVDSSTVVALMQAESREMGASPVRTFTIGFDHPHYDESAHARAVAAHLRTEHTALTVTAKDALEVIPGLPAIYDEPFADSSQIPTFLISALARQHVTVALSGDGGDELFGGYTRHMFGARVYPWVSKIPASGRRFLASVIRSASPTSWDQVLGAVAPMLPRVLRLSQPGYRLQAGARVLSDMTRIGLYRNLCSHWEPSTAVIGGHLEGAPFDDQWPQIDRFAEQMMAMDSVTYLPNDILTKVDRAAMAVSLETRMPYLDHELFELVWRLPLEMKIRHGRSKWILRETLYRHVPKVLFERPKMGFAIPLDAWLRGPLRDWAGALLDESRLSQEGYFDPSPIRQKWHQHLAGTADWHYHLWDVLMFQAWLDSSR